MRLTTTIRPLVHGGRAFHDRLGRTDLPHWSIGESWEACDDATGSIFVTNGRFSGWSLRDLVEQHPQEVLGRPSANRFPLCARLVDATGVGPLQMDCPTDPDRTPTSTAWHVLDAPPGSVARCGVLPGVSAQRLHEAILDQDFDPVMRQVPVRPGSTLCVPEGTLHGFGPHTLLYAASSGASRTVSVSRWHDEDGSPVPFGHWQHAIDEVVRFGDLGSTPMAHSGQPLRHDERAHHVELCAFDDLSLERLQVAAGADTQLDADSAVVLTNVGAPATLSAGSATETLARGRTSLLPAILLPATLRGPADVLITRPGAAPPPG